MLESLESPVFRHGEYVKERSETDIITEIHISDGFSQLEYFVSVEFESKTKLESILKRICGKSGLKYKNLDQPNVKLLELGYVDYGSMDTVLNRLTQNFNFNWSIQNGTLMIASDKPTKKKEVLVLSSKSGLLLSPENLVEISQKTKDADKTPKKYRYRFKSLLMPQVEVYDYVRVESQDINGNFRVMKLMHKCSTRTDMWYTTYDVE